MFGNIRLLVGRQLLPRYLYLGGERRLRAVELRRRLFGIDGRLRFEGGHATL